MSIEQIISTSRIHSLWQWTRDRGRAIVRNSRVSDEGHT